MQDIDPDAELEAAAEDSLLARAAIARDDPNEFCTFVLKNEEGKHVQQSRVHRVWHALMSRHKRLAVLASVELGKTQHFAIGRVLWELGRNPNLRICVLSNTQGMAQKTIGSIRRYIEQDADLHLVFPDLKRGDPWTNTMLYVQRPSISRDPSLQCYGVHGNVMSARIDLLILDDIVDGENGFSPAGRRDLWVWYNNTIPGRMTANSRIWYIGNAWHPEDFGHQLQKQPDVWASYKFPVMKDDGTSQWPEMWPLERIDEKRLELAGEPAAFARMFMCQARDDTDARFKQSWVDLCSSQGVGKRLVYDLSALFSGSRDYVAELPKGFRTYTGVDLAVARSRGSGKVVLFTGLVHPDGKRQPLMIESGRWMGQEILDRLESHHHRYRSVLIIESNAAQEFIRQFASARALPAVPFTTGRNKSDEKFGVESIAAELARGEWIIPCDEPAPGRYRYHAEISQWIQDMLFYDPAAHTGDSLMAAWMFREGARKGVVKRKSRWGLVDLMER